MSKPLTILITLFTLVLPSLALADTAGQLTTFFIEPSQDIEQRTQVQATLQKVSEHAYFYLETTWYNNLTKDQAQAIDAGLQNLSQEFDQTIYPQLIATYGNVWSPGIDSDPHITILFHQTKQGTAGYFKTEDESPKLQSPNSNEREMLYLTADSLFSPLAKSFLAHEFTHLITFNQKDRLRGISEEIWLNEARADYAPTLLGYDEEYQGSNLQQRVKAFLEYPSDSLTEWQNQQADYGVISVFINYLVDHYGTSTLVDSLKSSQVGIASFNQALQRSASQNPFSQVFTDWAITMFLNDCGIGEYFCYKSANLQNIKISPSLILLPSSQKTEFSLAYATTYWAGNWYRIIGGSENLEVVFQGAQAADFKVAYVLCKDFFTCQVSALDLATTSQNVLKGTLSFDNFQQNYTSLTLIPIALSKTLGFNGKEENFNFSLQAKSWPTTMSPGPESPGPESPGPVEEVGAGKALIAELKAKIAALKTQIAELQTQLTALLAAEELPLTPSSPFSPSLPSNFSFNQNLFLGLRGSDVKYLQAVLNQDPATAVAVIGPGSAGQETTYFGPLTFQAVIKFQQKYASEILTPLNLTQPTGFVGPATRTKLNQIISNQ